MEKMHLRINQLILKKSIRRRRSRQAKQRQQRNNTLPPLGQIHPQRYSIFHKYKDTITRTNQKLAKAPNNIWRKTRSKPPKPKCLSLGRRRRTPSLGKKRGTGKNKENVQNFDPTTEDFASKLKSFLKKKARIQSKSKTTFAELFSVKEFLGKGSNSKVYLCQDRKTETLFAVKMISKVNLRRPNQALNFKVNLTMRTRS